MTEEFLYSLELRLAALERSSSARIGPGFHDIEQLDQRAKSGLAELSGTVTQQLGQLDRRLAELEKRRAPDVPKHVAAALEPVVEELFLVDQRHTQAVQDVRAGVANAAADASRAAHASAVIAAEAVISWATRFAYGD